MAAQRDRREAYLDKARSELGDLAAAGVVSSGNAFSSVLLVKAEWPFEADGSSRPPLAGEDGVALRAALGALGYAPEDWMAISTIGAEGLHLAPELIRRAILALDPGTIVVCDGLAAAELGQAFASELSRDAGPDDADPLPPGELVHLLGMRVLNLDGFAEALADPREKQRRWHWLKQVRVLGEPF